MHISVTGCLGSGKSTVCKLLADKHELLLYSTGTIHRNIALSEGLTTLQMNERLKDDSSLDNMIDFAVRDISHQEKANTIIFDSRMAWHFAEDSFKVYITADSLIAATRVYDAQRGKEEHYNNVQEAQHKLYQRSQLEKTRFMDKYSVDYFDYNNYHLIIDSTYLTPEQVCELIWVEFCSFGKSDKKLSPAILLSPMSLYPTQRIRDISQTQLAKYISLNKDKNAFPPVSISIMDSYHFIIDGHHRVLSALVNKLPIIRCELAHDRVSPVFSAETALKEQLSHCGVSTLYDFETIGNFTYASYPAFYQA